MASLTWSDKYSVNIREIDQQHQKLFKMINDLDAAMREGRGKQVLGKILNDLIQYTASHFATEEGLMQKHGYPEYEEHKAKHEKMTQKVLDIQREYEAGKATITLDVMKFLQDWLDKHIMGTDRRYGPFLNAKRVL